MHALIGVKQFRSTIFMLTLGAEVMCAVTLEPATLPSGIAFRAQIGGVGQTVDAALVVRFPLFFFRDEAMARVRAGSRSGLFIGASHSVTHGVPPVGKKKGPSGKPGGLDTKSCCAGYFIQPRLIPTMTNTAIAKSAMPTLIVPMFIIHLQSPSMENIAQHCSHDA